MNMTFRIWSISIVFLYITISCKVVNGDSYGVLIANVAGSAQTSKFCITYDPGFHELPHYRYEAERRSLKDLTDASYELLCRPPKVPVPGVQGSVVAALRGNCTFSEKARLAQWLGASALLVVSPQLSFLGANSSADYKDINITVAMIESNSFQQIKNLGRNVSVYLYEPESTRVDLNLLVIWLLATCTVAVGAFWSGRIKYQLWLNKLGALPGVRRRSTDVEFSPLFVVFTVLMMCLMLLGLYFFYAYLVYVIIALFVIAASLALHDCLLAIFQALPLPDSCRCRVPSNRLPWLRQRPQIAHIVLFFISLGVGVLWFVVRHESYAWFLQDILGILFCIQMMKAIRLPNFKTCVILLVLLFIYDIFFVFVTPLFTKNGHSVMIDVATGGGSGSGEMLPMVLIVPRLIVSDSSVCQLPYSLLGFGDILVPGLLLSFCYGFDLQVKARGIYFISTVCAYGVGLLATFVALALMHSGQPALLYLVPCTLLTAIVVGWRRKELGQLWVGRPKRDEELTPSDGTTSTRTESPDENDVAKPPTVEEQEHLINNK